MISLPQLYFLVISHFLITQLMFPSNDFYISFRLIFQCIGYSWCIVISTNYFTAEVLWHLNQSLLKETFWFMQISKELSVILNIRSDEWSIGVGLQYFLLTWHVILKRILEGIMIILYWSRKESMWFLSWDRSTFFEKWAVNSISFVLEVTDSK